MVRGTFGNIRLRNQLLASVGEEITPGGYTYDFLDKKPTTIFEASRDYIDHDVPLVVLAGKEYGTGSSRDWAAKGTVSARRQGCDHRKLRAHPSLQPDRHGRAAAAVPGRRIL
jgi:aconitase_1: aconitate hydratase 1